jgi:hypothetical protein
MQNMLFNPKMDDVQRRQSLFAGNLIVYGATKASMALCQHAIDMAREAFDPLDPEHAQELLPVEKFIEIVGPLKSRFTNGTRTKELVRDYLVEQGIDPAETFFDVPRLRVVPHSGYLTAGVSYAYKAHRDTWYAGPHGQLNWWMPVFEVVSERAMSFFPKYWANPIPNSSSDFDYDEWVNVGRKAATQQVTTDTRKHPLPLIDLPVSEELRICGRTGDAIVFSAAHLHATAPNTSQATRFSLDFRTIHVDDISRSGGARNLDSQSKGTTLGDFVSVQDFAPVKEQYVLEAQ